MNLKRAIKEVRKEKGYSQVKASKLIGISPTTLCRLEAGLIEVSPRMLKRISEGYDVSPVIFTFKAVDRNDIKPEKQSAYDLLKPSLDALINEII